MNTKFEFVTSDTKNGLTRIRALKDFGNVKKGNLGGYLEKETNLSENGDAWVSDNALVSGNARVSGNAQVFDNARVSGNSRVSDNARVYGNSRVSGNALVSGDARVSGNAQVFDNAQVSDNALVSGNAVVSGNAWVYGNAQVSGNAICTVTPIHMSGFVWMVTISDKHMQIGCECHTFDEWMHYTDGDIIKMDGKDALRFWRSYKDMLFIAIYAQR